MTFEIAVLISASIGVIALTALLGCIDTSILVADDVKMSVLLENPSIKESTRARLLKISKKRDRHMTAMTVFMTFIGVSSSSVLGVLAYKELSSSGVLVYLLMLTYGNLVFSRTFPKVIARNYYESVLTRFAWLARLIYVIAMPLVLVTLVWVKIFKLDKPRKMNLQELKGTISYYHEKGLIEHSEASMLNNIFQIKQHRIDTLITPTNLPCVDREDRLSDCKEIAIKHSGNRILVSDGTRIVGIMYYRDLVSKLIADEDGLVSDLLRNTITVADCESLLNIMVKMKEHKVGQVVVTDELGKPLGVVTAKEISHILASSVEKPLGKIK